MGRAMVWLIAAAWSVVAVLPAAATQAHTIETGGLTRTHLLHVPPTPPAGPAPLGLCFHRGGGPGPRPPRPPPFRGLAHRRGVPVPHPAGVSRDCSAPP